ncbi:MAG: glycosyltransferase [Candidatus Berkiella sp.]
MKAYDRVFVTHLPAFYKVNLYNEIAKRCKVFVIFIASTSAIRSKDFTQGEFAFDYCVLNEGPFESRSKLKSLFRLYQVLKTLRFKQIIVGGWDLLEFWLIAYRYPTKSNALACESSIFESKTQGLSASLKKAFLERMQLVYCSGEAQKDLVRCLSFKGDIKKTLGVGIFNYTNKKSANKTFQGKFLYVGRLAPEKNLESLVRLFAKYPQYQLTLIGQGPLAEKLQAMDLKNVNLVGHVSNEALSSWYQSHDVFVLPSTKEPWGLVVEEALYHGLPVIASAQVGSAQDFIIQYQVGKLFEPGNNESFDEAVTWCAKHYSLLLENLKMIDFKARDAWQVEQYLTVKASS